MLSPKTKWRSQVELAAPVGCDRAIDAGARAEERTGDGCWRPTRRAEQQNMEPEQMSIASAPQLGQHLLLFDNGDVKYRVSRHSRFTNDKGLDSTYRFIRKNPSVPIS